MLMLLGGILLVLPGFLTDLAGALLLIPGLRAWIHATFSRAESGRAPGPPGVVDLTPEEWERVPEERLRHQPQDARKP